MELSMPNTVPQTPPGEPYQPRQYVFYHWPDLRELLPKWRGVPGFEYLQCCVVNLRRAQDENWVEVDNTVVYTIEGPKGSVDLKLLCRGRRTPGQPHDSGVRLCLGDRTGEGLTGVWINPHKHAEEPTELESPESLATQTSVKEKEEPGA